MSFLYLLERKCDDTWEAIAEEVISKLSRQTAKELLFEARLDALHHKFLGQYWMRSLERDGMRLD
jgi:hypothetical protein